MNTLIGLVGKARSGKDSVFRMMELLGRGRYCRVAFADALKRQVAAAVGVPVERIEEDKALFRPTLQAFGVLRRDLDGVDYWVSQAAKEVSRLRERGLSVVVTDCRFLNEAAWIRSEGGVLVRVVREEFSSGVPEHVSETEMEAIETDYELRASSLDGLKARVECLLPYLET